jgi:hypothetical protein
MTYEEVRYIIKCGDDLFLQTSLDENNENGDKVMLTKAAIEVLGHFHYDMEEEDLLAEEEQYDAEEDLHHDFIDWAGESSTHDINPSEKDDADDDNELHMDNDISNTAKDNADDDNELHMDNEISKTAKEIENENGLDDNCIQPNADIGATTNVEIAIEETVNDGADLDNDGIQPNADIGGSTVEVAVEEHVVGKDDDAVHLNNERGWQRNGSSR